MLENEIYLDDSLNILKKIDDNTVDVIYLDPPFCTQDIHRLISGKDNAEYSFSDKWESTNEYLKYMQGRLSECKRVLKKTGSIFLHCDRNASHYLKILMDRILVRVPKVKI